ncbi:hypothetical protein BDZ90DRAFT_267678 [Jaminaea rosea]|uniref:Uncharacterized protein n=1 Tax=Jaminaea rosea TaxID=1569628 RepID=A0A316UK94_9BASI|nr:hypothetical protein BDZ90DRAFT_267678 [Jaminaea rosea]PWN25722.1 hypothetical protein BDZ90DRAFT_267678 [Jaminaea rosea]
MTSLGFTRRLVIDGKGYRFTLPPLGFPDPEGDYATVEVSITDKYFHLLTPLPTYSAQRSEPRLRCPSGEYDTIEVCHAEAIWYLPVLQPQGTSVPETFRVRVRRLPAGGTASQATAGGSYFYFQSSVLMGQVLKDSLKKDDRPDVMRRYTRHSLMEHRRLSSFELIRLREMTSSRSLDYATDKWAFATNIPETAWQPLPAHAMRKGAQRQYVNAARKFHKEAPISSEEWVDALEPQLRGRSKPRQFRTRLFAVSSSVVTDNGRTSSGLASAFSSVSISDKGDNGDKESNDAPRLPEYIDLPTQSPVSAPSSSSTRQSGSQSNSIHSSFEAAYGKGIGPAPTDEQYESILSDPEAQLFEIKLPHGSIATTFMRGTYHLETGLNVNSAFNNRINWVKYVDKVPKGDRVPLRAERADPRLVRKKPYWSADVENGTLSYITSMPAARRKPLWTTLTEPGAGLPCTIKGSTLEVTISKEHRIALPAGHACTPGRALLKMVPVDASRYACQPSAASAEASYFLKHYQLILAQNGKQIPVCEPLSSYLDMELDTLLSILGEFASVEGRPGKILYSVASEPHPSIAACHDVGVRLRDGGARFPIINKGKDRKRIKMPSTAFLHSKWGTFVNIPERDWHKEREVNLRIEVTGGQPQDLVLRVKRSLDGDYGYLEHAFRSRGSFEPIRDDEWKLFWNVATGGGAEPWVGTFFLKIARLSFGREEVLRPAEWLR